MAALAPLSAKPVTACLLAYEAEAAAAVAALPFFKARVEEDATLARIVVQVRYLTPLPATLPPTANPRAGRGAARAC